MGPSHTVSKINIDSSQKLQIFPPPCILQPRWQVPLELGVGARVKKTRMMELPDGPKSFKIDLVL